MINSDVFRDDFSEDSVYQVCEYLERSHCLFSAIAQAPPKRMIDRLLADYTNYGKVPADLKAVTIASIRKIHEALEALRESSQAVLNQTNDLCREYLHISNVERQLVDLASVGKMRNEA